MGHNDFNPEDVNPALMLTLALLTLIIYLIIVYRPQLAAMINYRIEKIDDYFALRRHKRRERNRLEATKKAVQYGVITPNEGRARHLVNK